MLENVVCIQYSLYQNSFTAHTVEIPGQYMSPGPPRMETHNGDRMFRLCYIAHWASSLSSMSWIIVHAFSSCLPGSYLIFTGHLNILVAGILLTAALSDSLNRLHAFIHSFIHIKATSWTTISDYILEGNVSHLDIMIFHYFDNVQLDMWQLTTFCILQAVFSQNAEFSTCMLMRYHLFHILLLTFGTVYCSIMKWHSVLSGNIPNKIIFCLNLRHVVVTWYIYKLKVNEQHNMHYIF